MSTNFIYGSGNPLFQAPKKETKKETKKPTETKAQIDARIAATTKKVTEQLKPLQEKYGVDPATGGLVVPASGGSSGGSTPLTDEQIRENERAYQKQQDAIIEAEKLRRAGQSAYDLLLAEFNRYGLGTLLDDVKSLIVTGADEASLTLALRQTKAYQARFAANKTRIDNGLRALSEAEYVTLEDQ
jgi:hypothetical protein